MRKPRYDSQFDMSLAQASLLSRKPISTLTPNQDHEFKSFIQGAKSSPYIAVDTETTGQDCRDGSGYAMGISISYRYLSITEDARYFPFRHKTESQYNLPESYLRVIKDLIENHKLIIFHNAKFDLVTLQTLGIDYQGKFADTMIMAHWLNENLLSKELDYLCKKFLHLSKERSGVMDMYINSFGWENIPPIVMAPYAANDASITGKLYEFLRIKFEREFKPELWEIEQKFIRLLIEMEKRGISVDTKLADEQYKLGTEKMQEIVFELGASPASSKDLQMLLIDRLHLPVLKESTKTNKPLFPRDIMEKYADLLERLDDKTARLILDYRGWSKTTSSYWKPYLELVSSDGRLRPNYHLHRTVTGRLSCSSPNLQQIPRISDKPWNGTLKQGFIPKPGYHLYEGDYSQLELRLATAYAKEQSLLEIFQNDRDIFDEMSKDLGMARHDTKTLVYTILYGGGERRLMEVFHIPQHEAASIRNNYFKTYPGFRKISSLAADKCTTDHYINLWSGRRRHFAEPREEAHKAFNSVIQGGAAEIVKRTMLRLKEEVDCPDARMLLQVHDSVVWEIKEDCVDKFVPLIQQVMEDVTPDFGVPFKVKVKLWGT